MDKWGIIIAVFYAIAAAALYAINVPCSKILLTEVPPVSMAGLLYLGAGIGVGGMWLVHYRRERKEERLTKADFPYTIGMVVLDIVAPIFLMMGIKYGTSSNASLLGNFEIVATAIIALLVFRERVSWRLWIAILLITASSMVLTYDGHDGLGFSIGSAFVLCATVCWGLENNCTRCISEKSTYQIVTIKGICSGIGALVVAAVTGESLFPLKYIPWVLLLGFVAYGLSIFTYIRAQKTLGAAKTSAYYSIAPFIGAFLAFVVLGEALSAQYVVALSIMIVGTLFIIYDTLVRSHSHKHSHTFTHIRNGVVHSHTITHSHKHSHFSNDNVHHHHHSVVELKKSMREANCSTKTLTTQEG
jgi:drug/metabolite transporter (DMT)-like permease